MRTQFVVLLSFLSAGVCLAQPSVDEILRRVAENQEKAADARKTVRVVMQEYLRRDSLLPVLRLVLDLAFLAAAIIGACAFDAWWAKLLMVIPGSIAIARLFGKPIEKIFQDK